MNSTKHNNDYWEAISSESYLEGKKVLRFLSIYMTISPKFMALYWPYQAKWTWLWVRDKLLEPIHYHPE